MTSAHYDQLETRDPEQREIALFNLLPGLVQRAMELAPGWAQHLADFDPAGGADVDDQRAHALAGDLHLELGLEQFSFDEVETELLDRVEAVRCVDRDALAIAALPYAFGHPHAADAKDTVTLKRVAALLLQDAQAALVTFDGGGIVAQLVVDRGEVREGVASTSSSGPYCSSVSCTNFSASGLAAAYCLESY